MEHLESVGSQRVERVVQFRARRGADLLRALEEAVAAEGVRCAAIVSGLGALERAVFRNLRWFPERYPVRPEDRLYLEVARPMELVSLTGWVAPREDGGAEIHAHFAASTVEADTVVTLGGHLTEGTICGIKVVVALLVLGEGARAEIDPATRTLDVVFGSGTGARGR